MANHEMGACIELIVVAVNQTSLRCIRLPDRSRLVFRPTGGVRYEVEGEVLTVEPRKEWTYKSTTYVSGTVLRSTIDGSALSEVPLRLYERGDWDPNDEFLAAWLEEGDEDEYEDDYEDQDERILPEDVPDSVLEVIRAGVRKTYEMEQVIPGEDWNDPDSDPIIESVDLLHAGAVDDARRVLQQCLTQDTRCIDAYVHLGNIRFRHYHSEIAVEQALKSYRAGVAVGEQALPEGFNGLLLWGYIDNRPFLRALHGLALCEWRLGRTSCARSVFMRLLMLDPDDALRVRFSMHALDCGLSYVDYADEEVC